MTTRRVVIGRRANGQKGVFIAPPGIDAYTAVDSQLTLGVGTAIPQLVMEGWLSSSTTLPLGFSHSPIVLLHSMGTFNYLTTINGPMRPSPMPSINSDGTQWTKIAPSYAQINSNGASVSFSIVQRTYYQIYNKAW